MRQAQNHKDLTIFGDGEQTRDFVFVRDLVQAVLTIFEKAESIRTGDVFNIGNETETSINKLAETISSYNHCNVVYQAERPGDIKYSMSCTEHIRSIGWKPSTELAAGIQETWNWFVNGSSSEWKAVE